MVVAGKRQTSRKGLALHHLPGPPGHPKASPTGLRGQLAAYPTLLLRLCSRGWGMCLDDTPAKEVIDFPSVLPGVLYDVGHQCRLQYGAYSVFCDGMDVSVGHTGAGGMRAMERPLACRPCRAWACT